MLAQDNEYIMEASDTILKLTEDEKIRMQCEVREDFYRRQRTQQNYTTRIEKEANRAKEKLDAVQEQLNERNAELESKRAELEAKDAELEAKDAELEAKDAEIARLKEMLTETKNKR